MGATQSQSHSTPQFHQYGGATTTVQSGASMQIALAPQAAAAHTTVQGPANMVQAPVSQVQGQPSEPLTAIPTQVIATEAAGPQAVYTVMAHRGISLNGMPSFIPLAGPESSSNFGRSWSGTSMAAVVGGMQSSSVTASVHSGQSVQMQVQAAPCQ